MGLIDEEGRKLHDKYTRRKRAELLRRLSETLLLGGIGYLVYEHELKPFSLKWKQGSLTVVEVIVFRLIGVFTEILGHLGVALGTYILYPLRLLYRRSSGKKNRSDKRLIRIPAAFDPAPLLYPLLIPVFVAWSLAASYPKVLLPNLILSLASIPGQVIPFHDDVQGYSSMHWFLSIIPLMTASAEKSKNSMKSTGPSPPFPDVLKTENLTILYPLHQALLPSLEYLTTTSLLPAELQLLSISMINLLFFSSSPQSWILNALLWVGGLPLFIFCGTVLRWEVALARIPSWRFRHPHLRSREGNVILCALDDCFYGLLSRWEVIPAACTNSDNDGEGLAALEKPPKRRLERLSPEIQRSKEANPRLELPVSAIDEHVQDELSSPPDTANLCVSQLKVQRRHTLLSYVGSTPGGLSSQKAPQFIQSQFSLIKPRSFLSFTYAQATVTKWVLALYVYLMVLVIIAIPIRILISRKALHGQEPIGWALGYLFGNLPLFRSIILTLDLENWVPLPLRSGFEQDWNYRRWSHKARKFGAANARLILCAHCFFVLAAGLRIVFHLTAYVAVDTRRKVFHGMMVVMFLPSILIDPAFASLALALALAIFLILDLFRASQLPPLSRPLTHFLAPFVDGRDHRGPVIISHIFLLIGCAIPLWLSLAAVGRTGVPPWDGWDVPTRDVSMVSGVICVGMGDAAASLRPPLRAQTMVLERR